MKTIKSLLYIAAVAGSLYYINQLFTVDRTLKNEPAIPTGVSQINQETRQHLGKKVRLKGIVYNTRYLAIAGYYEVVETTTQQSIFVLCTDFPPQEGTEVEVTGVLKPLFEFSNTRGLLIREIQTIPINSGKDSNKMRENIKNL